MRPYILIFLISVFSFQCIGEDFVDDYVDPSLRITNPILSIQEGLNYQFKVKFFDESGTEVDNPNLNWSADPPSAISISSSGVIEALSPENVRVSVSTQGLQGSTITTNIQFSIQPNASTEVTTPTTGTTSTTTNGIDVGEQYFEGELKSTSSYLLEGNFRYEYNASNVIVLSLDENYRADTALPGLYVYLTNNPNSPTGGYEIGKVSVLNGAHHYTLPTSIKLMDYKYILYWCKPFRVKIGDGQIFED